MSHCNLEPGAVIFYEQFEGNDGLKDRYFIVVRNYPPSVDCFTTTTRDYPAETPHLATEYVLVELDDPKNCLPKRCFVDLRHPYQFDDISLSSKLRSKSVKHKCDLPKTVFEKLCSGIAGSRTLSRNARQALVASMTEIIDRLE